MRTTIEIPDDLRPRLVELAARKGMKGYSPIVAEALRRYLDEETSRAETARRLARFRGAWSKEQADEVLERIQEVRERWTLSSTPRP